jgi:hypothetical protein
VDLDCPLVLLSGAALSVHTREYLDAGAAELNSRPCKTLDWDSLAQRLNAFLVSEHSPSVEFDDQASPNYPSDMATVQDLVHRIDHPDEDDDGTEVYLVVDELVAEGDRTLLAGLETELERYLAERNFFARDAVAAAIAGIRGVDALPLLLRAASRDVGDDQDGLSAEILDLIEAYPARARLLINQVSNDPHLQVKAAWASQFLS